MRSPFPGMNPYLEHPDLFPGLHHLLISEIARFLSPQLRPKYRIAVEVRMYETSDSNSLLVGIPDVVVKSRQQKIDTEITSVATVIKKTEPIRVVIPTAVTIREGYLSVREVGTEALITSIEVLSPTNKRPGKGRRVYEKKRELILSSLTNLVEIDLLRQGESMPMIGNNIQSHYAILVSRGDRRPEADLYAFNLQDVIPSFPLPLRPGDQEPLINLQELLSQIYELYDYDLIVDYNTKPIPSLSPSESLWLATLLQEKGLQIPEQSNK